MKSESIFALSIAIFIIQLTVPTLQVTQSSFMQTIQNSTPIENCGQSGVSGSIGTGLGTQLKIGDKCSYQDGKITDDSASRDATQAEKNAVEYFFRESGREMDLKMSNMFSPSAKDMKPKTKVPCFCSCCTYNIDSLPQIKQES